MGALVEKARRQVNFKIIGPTANEQEVFLGAHTPNYRRRLESGSRLMAAGEHIPCRRSVHHRDVVRVALNRLERDLRGQSDVMLDFYKIENEEKNGKKNDGTDARRS